MCVFISKFNTVSLREENDDVNEAKHREPQPEAEPKISANDRSTISLEHSEV